MINSQRTRSIKCRLLSFLIACPVLALLICPNCFAASDEYDMLNLDASYNDQPLKHIRHKLTGKVKLIGFRLSPDLYVGQARFGKERDFALVVDKGTYSYGLSHDKFNIALNF